MVSLPEERTVTGEEAEVPRWTGQGSLFEFDAGRRWRERGKGAPLKLSFLHGQCVLGRGPKAFLAGVLVVHAAAIAAVLYSSPQDARFWTRTGAGSEFRLTGLAPFLLVVSLPEELLQARCG